ncbi:MAG TPA: hypothetical protein VJB15_12230, partial [Rhodothermia bacterium]|nr:hypothetical protein [Rhodothermia bacterium]
MRSNRKRLTRRRQVRRVHLPMVYWQRLARSLMSEDAVLKVLRVLEAGSRTYASLMAYAIAQWRRGEDVARTAHPIWRPYPDVWLRLAHRIALERHPKPLHTVQELRACLIACGQHEDLLRLDAEYGNRTSAAEFRQLADTLRSGDQKYEWSRWNALLEARFVKGDPDTHRYVADKKASAVLD